MTAAGHARLGWWMLAVFAAAGLVLESLIGLRVPWLLDVGMETRRTMWRLAHAHGALFGLVHIALAACATTGLVALDDLRGAARLLVAGTLAVPAGFLLGGLWFLEADPGLGIVLVPIGALALISAAISIARAVRSG